MNTKDYKAVDPATSLSLEALRKASEGALKVYDFLPLHPKVVLYLLDMIDAEKLDAARYKFIEQQHSDPDGNLCVNIAYESQLVEYAYGKTWPDLSGAIDAAMAATKGEA